MTSTVPVLSKEETNFLRVANLLIRLSPKAVRVLFNRELSPTGLKSVLSKNWTNLDKLKKKHVITQTQWSLLFPSGSNPKSKEFDLTLMVCLLRNLIKMTIQDQLPQPSDLSEGAAVSRIKFYRNKIVHSDSGMMSDAEFSTTFAEVSKILVVRDAKIDIYRFVRSIAKRSYATGADNVRKKNDETETYDETGTNAETETDLDTNIETETDLDTNTETETDLNTNTETETDLDTNTETETDAKTLML
ncbi:unnamed protein product [Mytilus edulis]|uniref:DZIP3-like HEPN domain-containing protein n=1 Tax=Mytilus edulis TaxID=6550 RepID=A0A8S3UQH0_MYTED|nr:unnamed protein product [Mytilus edulis]